MKKKRHIWADTACMRCAAPIPETTDPNDHFTHLDPECEGWVQIVNGVMCDQGEVELAENDVCWWMCKACYTERRKERLTDISKKMITTLLRSCESQKEASTVLDFLNEFRADTLPMINVAKWNG